MGSNDTKYTGATICSGFVLYRRFFYWTIMAMIENGLAKIKFEMKSDAGGWGGGTFGDNVTIFLQLFYSESLHTDHIL